MLKGIKLSKISLSIRNGYVYFSRYVCGNFNLISENNLIFLYPKTGCYTMSRNKTSFGYAMINQPAVLCGINLKHVNDLTFKGRITNTKAVFDRCYARKSF